MNKAKEAQAELLTTQLRTRYLSAAGDRVWEKPLLVKHEGDILMHTKLYHRKATDRYFPQVLGSKFVIVLLLRTFSSNIFKQSLSFHFSSSSGVLYFFGSSA